MEEDKLAVNDDNDEAVQFRVRVLPWLRIIIKRDSKSLRNEITFL